MGAKGGFIHIGLVDIEVIGHRFVLNDIETEGARLILQAFAGMAPDEGDEFVHLLWLDIPLSSIMALAAVAEERRPQPSSRTPLRL